VHDNTEPTKKEPYCLMIASIKTAKFSLISSQRFFNKNHTVQKKSQITTAIAYVGSCLPLPGWNLLFRRLSKNDFL